MMPNESETTNIIGAEPSATLEPQAISDQISVSHQLLYRTGRIWERQQELKSQSDDVRRSAILLTVQAHVELHLKFSVMQELENLTTSLGMGWNDVARAVGISHQALRKWRHGGRPSPELRIRLAQLGAFLGILQGEEVQDPAAWLELPILPGYKGTRLDLFIINDWLALVDLAAGRIEPAEALGHLSRDWPSELRRQHEVFEAGDGGLAIRRSRT